MNTFFLPISRNDNFISRNDKSYVAFLPNFASSNIDDMSNVESHHSAMEYAIWYQEHLLAMEDAIGERLEAKIEEIIDRKFQQYMEQARKESDNNHHL